MVRKKQQLDAERLERWAFFYVGRYATSTGKLRNYLKRKLAEAEWEGERPADIDPIIEKCIRLGFVDDALFAATRTRSLSQSGYGKHRIKASLRNAGIESDLLDSSLSEADTMAEESALAFARRRKFGPYSTQDAGPELRKKQISAFLRAGHNFDLVLKILDLPREIVHRGE